MEEIQLALRLPAAEQKRLATWLGSWQLGQVLSAKVVDKSPAGNLLLQIGGHRITASADIPLQRGALLRLEVNGLLPVPSLKLIAPPPATPGPVNPLDRQLQLLLPQQGRVISPFLTLANPSFNVNLLSLPGVKLGTLDPHYTHFSQLPLPADPAALRQALRQSGFFLEHDLLNPAQAGGIWSQQDLKAMLLRLLGRTSKALERQRQAASERSALAVLAKLQEGLKGAIATITLKQLAACQVDEPDRFLWSFDLPFSMRDSLHGLSVSIKRDPADWSPEDEQEQWKILLTVTLPRLGNIDVEIFLRDRRVSLVLYAEREPTVHLVDAHLHRLRTHLEELGLEVSVLRCIHGSTDAEVKASPPFRLDEKI